MFGKALLRRRWSTMRTHLTHLIAMLSWLAVQATHACDCFPPELQIKTARDALQQARLAVYGRVIEVAPSGRAKVLVLESFKGPPPQSTIEATLDPAQCPTARFT